MDSVAKSSAADRRDLFGEAASRKGSVTPGIIEKDFWVCWTLKRLFSLDGGPAHLLFKGGTSLSKVFGVIERFSEDIDLSLDRKDLGFSGERDPYRATSRKKGQARVEEVSAACARAISETLLPALLEDFRRVLGPEQSSGRAWSLALDPGDPQTIDFTYPAGIGSTGADVPAYIRPIVRLEMGARSDAWPAEQRPIEPYAAQEVPTAFSEASVVVNVLAAERTFWEKVTILHAEFHRPGAGGAGPERLSRHYYDVARLFRSPIGERALGNRGLLEAVVAHKKLFFASGWANYDSARPGTLRLVPADARRKVLEADYGKMQEMIFGEAPPFAEILAVLAELEASLNGG